MGKNDFDLLRTIEGLIEKLKSMAESEQDPEKKERFDYTLKGMASLADAVLNDKIIFGIEPWHVIHEDVPLSQPGEMLLRLKDSKDEPMPPYPMIMTFYENDMTAEIDTVLFLCALHQFKKTDEVQVSINISARSLRDPDFVKIVIGRLETLDLVPEEKIIIEIHESTPHLTMNRKVLGLFRDQGVLFAIDDVGLSMNDVFRMAEFEDIADFIKVDRHSVRAHPENPNSLGHVVSMISSMLPNATMVAEGVKTAQHAMEVLEYHPAIKYVQGLYLPDRETFKKEWAIEEQKLRAKIAKA